MVIVVHSLIIIDSFCITHTYWWLQTHCALQHPPIVSKLSENNNNNKNQQKSEGFEGVHESNTYVTTKKKKKKKKFKVHNN